MQKLSRNSGALNKRLYTNKRRGCVISLWFTLFYLLKEIEYVAWRDRICCWKRLNKLLEEIGYVVETVSIFGRTTAVVRLHNSWYAHAQHLLCKRWSTVMHQLLSRLMTPPPFLGLYHHLLGNFLIACGMNALPVALPKLGATESVAAERVFLRAPLGS